jgi:Flp pilus assembly protein TadG
MVAMKYILSTLERRRRAPQFGRRILAGQAEWRGLASAVVRRRGIAADERGAVAFETVIVYIFIVIALLLPMADIAVAAFQYLSASAALRSYATYLQSNRPPDPTDTTSDATSISTWKSNLRTSSAGYSIGNLQVLCGDAGAGAACTSTNNIVQYYSYATSVTLTPIVLSALLCPTSCTYTLQYTERFQ